MKNNKKFKYLS